MILDTACVCLLFSVCFHLLTVWGDCLYGLALASDVPYGQSPVWVTANELLALVMPGNWVDRLGNDRQEAEEGRGEGFSGSAGWNIISLTLQIYRVAYTRENYFLVGADTSVSFVRQLQSEQTVVKVVVLSFRIPWGSMQTFYLTDITDAWKTGTNDVLCSFNNPLLLSKPNQMKKLAERQANRFRDKWGQRGKGF